MRYCILSRISYLRFHFKIVLAINIWYLFGRKHSSGDVNSISRNQVVRVRVRLFFFVYIFRRVQPSGYGALFQTLPRSAQLLIRPLGDVRRGVPGNLAKKNNHVYVQQFPHSIFRPIPALMLETHHPGPLVSLLNSDSLCPKKPSPSALTPFVLIRVRLRDYPQ